MSQALPQGVRPGTISFVFGHPDPALLPIEGLREAAREVLADERAAGTLPYGPEAGAGDLIGFLVSKLNRDEGLNLAPENLLITAGSTGAVDMIARLFVGSGGVALVEAPSYRDSLHVFRDQGCELVGVPIDDDGLVVDALAARLAALRRDGKRPRILYTIPNFQNPSGVTLGESRRREILALAEEYGFLVVEDDVYRDLAFERQPPPSFYTLADGRGVLRVGSFSKIVAPGLRVGWLVGSPDAIRRGVDCGVSQMGGGASPFSAAAVARFCLAGRLEPHIETLRTAYRRRCRVMLESLEREMPPGVEWTRPQGGFFIWVTLPEGLGSDRLQDAAAKESVFFSQGTGFYSNGGGERCFRLAFSFVPAEQIRSGVAVLARCIRRMLPD